MTIKKHCDFRGHDRLPSTDLSECVLRGTLCYDTVERRYERPCSRRVGLQQKMFGAFVYVFSVPMLEVGYGVVSDLTDEGVLMSGTLTEKFT